MEHLLQQAGPVALPEYRPERQQFVKGDTERVDVRSLVDDEPLAQRLLGAHVPQGPEQVAEPRQAILAPDPGQVQRLVSTKGLDLMKESIENRLLCCNVRKVQPLTKHLDGLDAWVTGLRRDQWATRTNIRKVEIDHDHGAIVKLNPLAEWTARDVWTYLREHDVPIHPLYARGFTSIGCAPCTRAVEPGEDDRAGRWWWESNAPKECGMHCSIEHGGFEHELKAILGK